MQEHYPLNICTCLSLKTFRAREANERLVVLNICSFIRVRNSSFIGYSEFDQAKAMPLFINCRPCLLLA